MFNLGAPELLVLGVLALLIFGRRLPDVARSLGQSFVEFKKGLQASGEPAAPQPPKSDPPQGPPPAPPS